jgi:hypothetical protein
MHNESHQEMDVLCNQDKQTIYGAMNHTNRTNNDNSPAHNTTKTNDK